MDSVTPEETQKLKDENERLRKSLALLYTYSLRVHEERRPVAYHHRRWRPQEMIRSRTPAVSDLDLSAILDVLLRLESCDVELETIRAWSPDQFRRAWASGRRMVPGQSEATRPGGHPSQALFSALMSPALVMGRPSALRRRISAPGQRGCYISCGAGERPNRSAQTPGQLLVRRQGSRGT